VTELLERGERTSLRGSSAQAQVVRRWVVVVLMDCAAVLGLLFAFPDWGAWASSTSSSSSWTGYATSMPAILLVATGVVIAVAMFLPMIWLARRVYLRSSRASWSTIVLSALVLITTIVQANSIQVLLFFLSSSVLMALVGLPLSQIRSTT